MKLKCVQFYPVLITFDFTKATNFQILISFLPLCLRPCKPEELHSPNYLLGDGPIDGLGYIWNVLHRVPARFKVKYPYG